MTGCLPVSRRRVFRIFRFRSRTEPFPILVKKGAFGKIISRLEYGSFDSNRKWLDNDVCQDGPLHYLLPHKPPLALVEQILYYQAATTHVPEEHLDVDGRTPLHVAVAHNCSLDVIERLLSGVSLVVPALTKDNMDRYPLHWACCGPKLHGKTEREKKFDTVLLLLNANPIAVNMRDGNGKTPLDYALFRDLDQRTVRILRKVLNRQEQQQQQNGPNNDVHAADTEGLDVPESVPATAKPDPSPAGYGIGRYFFQRNSGQSNADADDVSSLGWDRGSVAPSLSMSPSRNSVSGPANSPSRAQVGAAPTTMLTPPRKASFGPPRSPNNYHLLGQTSSPQMESKAIARSLLRGMAPHDQQRISSFS